MGIHVDKYVCICERISITITVDIYVITITYIIDGISVDKTTYINKPNFTRKHVCINAYKGGRGVLFY